MFVISIAFKLTCRIFVSERDGLCPFIQRPGSLLLLTAQDGIISMVVKFMSQDFLAYIQLAGP